MNRNRIEWIDIARGIAILLVIIGHSIIGLEINRFIFSFHIPLFFILSGYLFRRKEIKTVLIKNAYKILIPYYLTGLFLTFGRMGRALYYGWSNDRVLSEGWNTMLGVLLGYGADNCKWIFPVWMAGAIWFLLAYFWGELIVQIVFSITDQWKEWQRGILFILLAMIACLVGNYIWLPTNIDVGFLAAFFVYIGYLLHKNRVMNRGRLHIIVWIIIVILWVVASLTGEINMAIREVPTLLTIPGAISGSMLTMKLSSSLRKLTLIKKSLSWYGRNSLKVLCVHLLEMMLVPLDIYSCMVFGYEKRLFMIICRVLIATIVVYFINMIMSFRQKNRVEERLQ